MHLSEIITGFSSIVSINCIKRVPSLGSVTEKFCFTVLNHLVWQTKSLHRQQKGIVMVSLSLKYVNIVVLDHGSSVIVTVLQGVSWIKHFSPSLMISYDSFGLIWCRWSFFPKLSWVEDLWSQICSIVATKSNTYGPSLNGDARCFVERSFASLCFTSFLPTDKLQNRNCLILQVIKRHYC